VEGAETLQPEVEQQPLQTVATKRRRATTAPVAAVEATVAPTKYLDPYQDIAPVPPAGARAKSELVRGHSSSRSVTGTGGTGQQSVAVAALMDALVDDVLGGYDEEHEETQLPQWMAKDRAGAWADGGAGKEADPAVDHIVGHTAAFDSARATAEGLPADDRSAIDSSVGYLALPLLAFSDIDQTLRGWMGSVEHNHHQQLQEQQRVHHQQQQQLLRHQHQEEQLLRDQHNEQHRFEFGSSGVGNSGTGTGASTGTSNIGLDVRYSSYDEELYLTWDSATTSDIKREMEHAVMLMQQECLTGQHPPIESTQRRMGPPASVRNVAQTSTSDVVTDAYADRCHPPPLENQPSDTLDTLTLWTKLDGFSPSDFPMEGLAPELQRWLQGTPATLSGHIQPGCTLLTVDCLLPLGDATQIRTGGIHALAESILAGPLVGLGRLVKRSHPTNCLAGRLVLHIFGGWGTV
jgi:hypothetical protein